MRVFLQAVFGQILFGGYILWRGRQALPRTKAWRVTYAGCFLLEWMLYFTGYFFHGSLPESLLETILLVCNTWYIASIYVTMGMLPLEIVGLTQRRWKWYPQTVGKHWREIKLTLFFLFIAGVTGLMISAYHNVACPVARHLFLHVPKTVEGRDSLTVVLMCDTHFGETVGKRQAQRYVSLCNAQHPDVILVGGDLIDYESIVAEQAHIEDDLRQLSAPLGVYLVLGNHEYRANRHAKLRWIQKTGGILLVDSVAMPDSSFYIVGRDDALNPGRAALHTLMKGLDHSKPVIVLDHQPISINETLMNRADIALHGHTHNGQLWPNSLLLKFVYECSYGYYRKGDTQFYVSSGIGCAGPPYRVGTRSELAVLHITFDKNTCKANE
ncbi:MAG: metallophosphoesterase [Tannerella sp.]|jgi:predicted MPP superfamily phosphohydrolase|nr:metallophosphoesterase [Tannerella sp.]